MSQKEILEKFKTTFPELARNTSIWFPNGKNSIRVRQVGGQEFIFTYNDKKEWILETHKSFIKRMKGA